MCVAVLADTKESAEGVGVPNDALKRVLEVGLPLLPSPFESRKPFEIRLFFREDYFCKEGTGCDSNKSRVRYSKAGLPGLPLRFLAAGDQFWDSRVFKPPG